MADARIDQKLSISLPYTQTRADALVRHFFKSTDEMVALKKPEGHVIWSIWLLSQIVYCHSARLKNASISYKQASQNIIGYSYTVAPPVFLKPYDSATPFVTFRLLAPGVELF